MTTHRDRPTPVAPVAGVQCEQAVLTSALNALSQGGFGPVALSPGWPWPTDATAGLHDAVRYSQRDDAPPSLSVWHLDDGATCAVYKVPAGNDPGGRPGRYLVHALRAGNLHPGAALLAEPAATFITDWPIDQESTRNLPQVTLPGPAFEPEWAEYARPDLIAAILRYRDGSGNAVELIAEKPEDAAKALLGIYTVLPIEFTAQLTFSTFEEAESSVDISTRIVGISRERRNKRQVVDLTAEADSAVPGDAYAELAVQLLEAYPDSVPVAETVTELRQRMGSARLLAAAPSTLSDEDTVLLLTGPTARRWLDVHGDAAVLRTMSVARQPGRQELVHELRRLMPPEKREVVVENLRTAAEDAVLSGYNPATNLTLAETFAGGSIGFAEGLVRRAVEALDRGTLSSSSAAKVAEFAASDLAALDQAHKIAWLQIDDTPFQGELWQPWVEADIVIALTGPREEIERLEYWLIHQPATVSHVLAALLEDPDPLVREQRHTEIAAILSRVSVPLRPDGISAVLQAATAAQHVRPAELIAPMFSREPPGDGDIDSLSRLLPEMAAACGIPREVAYLFIDHYVSRRNWIERLIRRG